jgi:hypothetical protein
MHPTSVKPGPLEVSEDLVNVKPTEHDAVLAEFPELQRLVELRNAGWIFLPTVVARCVVQVHGVRTWPGGWADALRVRYTTDAAGLRNDHTGGITWQLEGTLMEVVDGLLTLPPPDDRLAPRLVVGKAPRLWSP